MTGVAVSESGRITVAARDGRVTSYDRGGNLDWSVATGHPTDLPPAVSFLQTVWLPSSDGYALGIDGRSGKLVFKARIGTRPRAPAVLALRGDAYIATEAGLAFSPGGERMWALAVAGGAAEPVLARNARLYTGGGDGSLVCVDAKSGAKVWTVSLGSPPSAAAVVDLDGAAYVATVDRKLHRVLDRGATAALQWTADLESAVAARPVLAPGGVLYAALESGAIVAVGRPLAGYRPACERWTSGGAGCASACAACSAQFDRCLSDPGCDRVARCVLATGCTTATGCSLPATCRSSVDSAGGINAESFRRAVALGRCAAQVCLGEVR
jgi:outer membrane protein assembly factor BamB